MRALPFVGASIDVALRAANGLRRLLDEEDVTEALGQTRRVMRPNGRLLISIRDYDTLRAATSGGQSGTGAGRRVAFQLWHWHDDAEHYDVEHSTMLLSCDGDAESRVTGRSLDGG